MRLSMSNKGWHSQWFYLKNATATPLPEFTGRLIKEAPEQWRKWGIPEKDKKKIQDHIAAIHILKENGLKGSGVIRAYHVRRVAPLMRAPSIRDGARGIVRQNGAQRGNAPQLRDHATHQGGDGAFAG